MKKNRFIYLQNAIMLFIWLLLFTVPLLFGDSTNEIRWVHIFQKWKEYSLILIVFLINRFVLVPYLFYKGKRLFYFASVITTVVILLGISFYNTHPLPTPNRKRPPMEMRHMQHDQKMMPPPHIQSGQNGIPPFIDVFILAILILGFDTGLNISMRWIQSEEQRVQLEKQNTEDKLESLMNQVSPHFLMNTLNNIHALVDQDTEKAKDTIIKLSHLMGYMLYETQDKKVQLSKEISFIKSYIELMELRFTDKVVIKLEFPEIIPKCTIPPLLFISFIENAFKYGISYQSPSYINIQFAFTDSKLIFVVENSIHERKEKVENSGLGIHNTMRRLDLIYGSKHNLDIFETDQSFNVKLELPL